MILAHGIDAATAPADPAAASPTATSPACRSSRSPYASIPQEGGSPDTTLAAQLLGFVNRDGVGQYGVEQYYQDALAGQPTVLVAGATAAGDSVADTARSSRPGAPGVGHHA